MAQVMPAPLNLWIGRHTPITHAYNRNQAPILTFCQAIWSMPPADLTMNPKSRRVKSNTCVMIYLILSCIVTISFIQFVEWLSSFERVPWYIFAVAMFAVAIPEIHYWRHVGKYEA
jgi:hypothetical protein